MEPKIGLARFCSSENLESLYSQLKNLRLFTNSRLSCDDLDDIVEDSLNRQAISYYSISGRSVLMDGTLVTKDTANYAEFDTGLKDNIGHKIFGYLYRPNNKMPDFRFLYWGYCIADMLTNYTHGYLAFSRRGDARRFFQNLADRAIRENWGTSANQDDLPYPILRSYIKHILKKIKTDEPTKLVKNKKEDMVLFNTNLFDDKFNEIYIVGAVDKEFIKNPYIVGDITDLQKVGFTVEKHHADRSVPLVEAPTFFEHIEDIVYQKNWPIKQGTELDHVIDRCKDRITTEVYKTLPKIAWSMMLKTAINFAVKVAKSNYKFIVPQYRFIDEADPWEKGKGNRPQLLMPIYLHCDISQKPDGVLVLDIDKIDKDHGAYYPKTILTIDQVYQNARLIAKPSEEWLSVK